jgi:hypothetical protein
VTLIRRLRRGRAQFLALGASPRHAESLSRVGRAGDGSVGRSTVAGARAAAGTLCAGQTPAISCSGEVESAWGHTTEALAGFIGAGVGRGHGRGLARHGARGFGRRACYGKVRARRTRGGVLLPMFKRLLRSQTCESWPKSGADLFLAPMAISCRDGNGFKTRGYRDYKPVPARLMLNPYPYPHPLPATGSVCYPNSLPAGTPAGTVIINIH